MKFLPLHGSLSKAINAPQWLRSLAMSRVEYLTRADVLVLDSAVPVFETQWVAEGRVLPD
jgi:hypothetical protein